MTKFLLAMVATLCFIVVLLAIYALHMRYFEVNVVFYASLEDAALATVLCGGLLYFVRQFSVFNSFEKLQLLAIWLLGGYAFAISVPTVIDRSLSFYLLEKLEQRGGGIRQDALVDVFINEYMTEFHLVDIRLTEQLESGTVVIRHGCVLLTPKGRHLAELSGAFRRHLLPKHRLLMGKYSDTLTAPFEDSPEFVPYRCQQSPEA